MKKYMTALITVMSLNSFAGEIVVLQTQIPSKRAPTEVEAKFVVDEINNLAQVKVVASKEVIEVDSNCSQLCSGGMIRRSYRPYYSQLVSLENLLLENDMLIYRDNNQEVTCGQMGYTRFLKRRVLFVTGNCILSSHLSREGNLKVSLRLKEEE